MQAWLWNFLGRNHSISGKTRIQGKGVEFKQIDRESNWDDYIILQATLPRPAQPPSGLQKNASLIRKRAPLAPYSRIMPRALWRSLKGGGLFLESEVPLYLEIS